MTSDFNIAVHALVYLANHRDQLTSSDALAEFIGTHPVRIRRVMIKLKESGMVTTKAGISGGYHINEEKLPMTLADVAKTLLEDYIHVTWHNRDDRQKVEQSELNDIIEHLFEKMNKACDDVLKRETIEKIASQMT